MKFVWLGLVLSFKCIFSRIDFLHVPKAGGTTIHSILENQFHISEIYPARRVNTSNSNHKDYIENLPLINHELVSGHFPYWWINNNDPTFESSFKIICLREPISRVLSHYRFRKRGNPNISVSIDDISNNWMCKMLCSDPSLEGEDLLADAKANLHKMDFVVFVETFEKDINLLKQVLGIPIIDETIPKFNTTNYKDLDSELLDIIRERNSLDVMLYDYAKNNITNSKEQYYQKYLLLEQQEKQAALIKYTFDQPLRGYNWCFRENMDNKLPKYRWVLGREGTIYFNLAPSSDYLMSFNVHTLKKGIRPYVRINNETIQARRVTNENFSRYCVRIPKHLINDGFTPITLGGSEAYIYNEVYPGTIDSRKLSIALNYIEIKPM